MHRFAFALAAAVFSFAAAAQTAPQTPATTQTTQTSTTQTPTQAAPVAEHVTSMTPQHPIDHGAMFGDCVSDFAITGECMHEHEEDN